jgi:hypothetical protein
MSGNPAIVILAAVIPIVPAAFCEEWRYRRPGDCGGRLCCSYPDVERQLPSSGRGFSYFKVAPGRESVIAARLKTLVLHE